VRVYVCVRAISIFYSLKDIVAVMNVFDPIQGEVVACPFLHDPVNDVVLLTGRLSRRVEPSLDAPYELQTTRV